MMNKTIEGDADRIRDFMRMDLSGPFLMLNMLKFRQEARYTGDHSKTPACSGQAAYQRYMAATAPLIEKLGATMAFNSSVIACPIAPQEESWDRVFHVHWPDKHAFIQMVTDPAYQAIVYHRMAALEDSRLIALAL